MSNKTEFEVAALRKEIEALRKEVELARHDTQYFFRVLVGDHAHSDMYANLKQLDGRVARIEKLCRSIERVKEDITIF